MNGWHQYDDRGYRYYDIVQECEQPARGPCLTEEELNELTPEDQIALLKEEVANLGEALSRCINIVNTLQHTVAEYMHYMDRQVDVTRYELDNHRGSFHSMLIIGNKEEKKDESDIS